MARVQNWQIGREMSYWYPESRPNKQFAAVFDINKCIACQTCTQGLQDHVDIGQGPRVHAVEQCRDEAVWLLPARLGPAALGPCGRARKGRSDPSLALLADAAGWRVLSLLLQRPAPGWGAQLEAMAGEVGDPALMDAVGLALPAGEGVYLSWLGPGGSVSARETGHQPLRDPGWLLADLSSFYQAFHYSPKRRGSARPHRHRSRVRRILAS